MEVRFYGHACFAFKSDKAVVVTDPYNESTGLKLPALKADIVTVSHNSDAYNNVKAIEGDPMVFNRPGEYEAAGVHFKGLHSFHNAKDDEEQLENTVFTINFDGVRFCHLGAQGTKLTPEQLELVGDVDILFLPIGGKGMIDAKKAKEIVEQIEPRIVIPMSYYIEGSNLELNALEAFLSLMSVENTEAVDVFKVKRSEMPEDNSKIVVINPSN